MELIRMMHGIARWSLVNLLLVGPAAFAETDYPPPGQPPISQPTTAQPVPWGRAAGFRMDCGQDVQQFCYGVQPGEGRLIRCLSSHRSQLSPACISRVAAARPGLRVDCGQDLQQFCYGVQPGEGRLIRCLSSHRSELSPACLSRVAAARPAPEVAPPSENTQGPDLPSASPPAGHAVTESALRASCGPDVERLCGGISRENGGAIKCLSSHRMELSPTCDAFFKEIPTRRAAQKHAPKSTPLPANGSTPTPAAANGAAGTGTPSALAASPAAADGAADTGVPPAANGPPTKSAAPAANSPPPARGALAFPL
jgi:Cysteine rich repeat